MPSATTEPVRPPPRRIARTIFWSMLLISVAPLLITSGFVYAYGNTQVARLSVFGLQLWFVLLLSLILILILCGWFIARQITRPIQHLSNTVTLFSNGAWDERAAIFGDDEVGRIAEVFNQLADNLRETYHLLNIQGPIGREDRLQLISGFAPIPSAVSTVEELLKATLDQIIKQLNCTCAAIYLIERKEPVGPTLAMLSHLSTSSDPAATQVARRLKNNVVNLDSTPTLEWPVGNAILSKRPQVAAVHGEPYLFEAAVPIIIRTPNEGERVLGAFDLYTLSRTKDERLSPFSLQTMNELQMLARVFGLALMGYTRIEGAARSPIPGLLGATDQGEQVGGAFLDSTTATPTPGAPVATAEIEAQRRSETALIQAIRQIVKAETAEEIYQTVTLALGQSPYSAAILLHSQITTSSESTTEDSLQLVYRSSGPPETTEVRIPVKMIRSYFDSGSPILIGDLDVHRPETAATPSEDIFRTTSPQAPEPGEPTSLPEPASLVPEILLQIPRQMGCEAAAFAPISRGDGLIAMLILGRLSPAKARSASMRINSRPRSALGSFSIGSISPAGYGSAAPLTPGLLEPYISLIELMAAGLQRINAQASTQRKLAELESLWLVGQVASVETDLNMIFHVLQKQIEIVMGSLDSFAIALYDSKTNMIRMPYMFEEGRLIDFPAFPLGTGLSSIVIRTRKPLLLVEDVARRSEELGAVIVGEPAKSWLGVPLSVGGEVIGVIIVQDIHQEHRFNEEDQRLLSTLATQIAVVIRNAGLLEASRRQAYQERLINEISASIRRSGDIQSILRTTTEELGNALRARRAHIQIDIGGEVGTTTTAPLSTPVTGEG